MKIALFYREKHVCSLDFGPRKHRGPHVHIHRTGNLCFWSHTTVSAKLRHFKNVCLRRHSSVPITTVVFFGPSCFSEARTTLLFYVSKPPLA